MNVESFLKTIYFGDRYCKKILIDSDNNNIEIHVNNISRPREISSIGSFCMDWDEGIDNGIIVFSNIEKVIFDESGLIPNDEIYNIYVQSRANGIYEFIVETSHVDNETTTNDLIIKIYAKEVYLIDPKNSKIKITK